MDISWRLIGYILLSIVIVVFVAVVAWFSLILLAIIAIIEWFAIVFLYKMYSREKDRNRNTKNRPSFFN